MSKLQAFLNTNPIDNLTDEVIISERFIDEEGAPLKFKIRAMTMTEYEDIRKRSTVQKKKKVDFNLKHFNMEVIKKFSMDPNFKDKESLDEAGCLTADSYIEKVLLPGEIQELASQIIHLSGFDQDIESLKDEAKN